MTSYHLYYSGVCSKCLPPAWTQARRRWRHSPTAHIQWPCDSERPCTRCWCVVSVGRRPRSWYDRLAPEALSTRYSQPGWGPASKAARGYPVWIHGCKRPNYDFWISQGTVATVLRWGWQKYSRLRQFSSWCCGPKIIKIGHGVIQKITLAQFLETRCTLSRHFRYGVWTITARRRQQSADATVVQ